MTDEEIRKLGFVPWHGGDEAPADWDGDIVLLRDKSVEHSSTLLDDDSQWHNDDSTVDIVGYRLKQPTLPEGVTAEWVERVVAHLNDVAARWKGDELGEAMIDEAADLLAEYEAATKTDPLVEALRAKVPNPVQFADGLRAELAKRGLTITQAQQ